MHICSEDTPHKIIYIIKYLEHSLQYNVELNIKLSFEVVL